MAITAEEVRRALEGAAGGQAISLRLRECEVEGLSVEFDSIGRDADGRIVIEGRAFVGDDDEGEEE